MMKGEIDLTILIPAYNEAKRLPQTLEAVRSYCATSLNRTFEILVVDDGSTDGTSFLIDQMQLEANLRVHHYSQNHGKGHALRIGMQLAQGKFILFMDADLSTPIHELSKFLPVLDAGMRVVIGTRKSTGANILKHQPLWRESMGKIFTWLSNKILGMDFSDLTCGFKGFESTAGKDIFARQRIDGWAFDSEILFLARQLGYAVGEIPVTWIDSSDSRVRPFRAAFTSLVSLFQIRWNWMIGKYTLRKSRESRRIPADV